MRSAPGCRRARRRRRRRRTARASSRSIARYTGGRALEPGATLEELGLSSLERIEMMVALEEALNTTIDETAFSKAGQSPISSGSRPRRHRRRRRPSRWSFRHGIARCRSARSAR